MPKIQPQGQTAKISLDQIIETGNVRKQYTGIEELAASIKKDGLVQPIVVKRYGENGEGVQLYELACGHRRIRAHRLLCEKGDDFSLIDAVIKTGDKRTLQLIENIQRENLSPIEVEAGVVEMLSAGQSQTEISDALCRPISWTSDIVAAAKVRAKADSAGIDTVQMSSKAISQLRSINDENILDAIRMALNHGGTVSAATNVMKMYKNDGKAEQEEKSETTASPDAQGAAEPESSGEVSESVNAENSATPAPSAAPASLPESNQAPVFQAPKENPPVKVPMNAIFDEIRTYMGNLRKRKTELAVDPEGNCERIHEIDCYLVAATDIIDLLQRRL
jgi:ParB family chromosome partitioning protein